VYATIVIRRRGEEEWIAQSTHRLEEAPGGEPLPAGLKRRVITELARVVSKWAKQNSEVLERAQRRVALERSKRPEFLGELRNALRKAMVEIATCNEYADKDTAGHLRGAMLHLMHLDTTKIPEVYAHIAKINKRRLAA
jgi:hypothetical protein